MTELTQRAEIDIQKQKLGEKFREHLTLNWYFEKAYEKLILIIIGTLGLWKFVELIWGWI